MNGDNLHMIIFVDHQAHLSFHKFILTTRTQESVKKNTHTRVLAVNT